MWFGDGLYCPRPGNGMISLFIAACMFAVYITGCEATSNERGRFCEGMDCLTHDELVAVIQMQKEQIGKLRGVSRGTGNSFDGHSIKKSLASITSRRAVEAYLNVTCTLKNGTDVKVDKMCNICHSSPCQNGGTCMPDPENHWGSPICECPENTRGDRCETVLVCGKNSCAENEYCTIGNHQTMCIPKPNTIRNITTKTACLDAGKYMESFDGFVAEMGGTCPYTFTKTCRDRKLPKGASPFSVTARNYNTNATSPIAYVADVEVRFYDQIVGFDKFTYHIFVNNITVGLPYYWPNEKNAKITVTLESKKFIIKNAEEVSVAIYPGKTCVSVPEIKGYKSRLCGVAGNMDGKKKNDLKFKNGIPVTDDMMKKNKSAVVASALDSWQTNFTNFENWECRSNGEVVATIPHTPICAIGVKECRPILDAKFGNGSLAPCHVVDPVAIDRSYNACVTALCSNEPNWPKEKCNQARIFMEKCAPLLGANEDKGFWRLETAMDCPLLCLPSAHNDTCGTSCHPTCAQPDLDRCSYGCTDDCFCDPGFIRESTLHLHTVCIPKEKCGCLDKYGNYHKDKTPWFDDVKCSIRYVCENQTMLSEKYVCGENAECIIRNNVRECACKNGYHWVNGTCVDTIECHDLTFCGQDMKRGSCINLPGSFRCDCIEGRSGKDCGDCTPKRHCADLMQFHNITKSGYYNIAWLEKGYELEVYCDMETEGGGWTLMSSAEGAEFANVTYAQYQKPFGGKGKSVDWLGLDIMAIMTQAVETSLRIDLHGCGLKSNKKQVPLNTMDIFNSFRVNSADKGYSIFIPDEDSVGNNTLLEGFLNWIPSEEGPEFSTFDNDKYECAGAMGNTGFWFHSSNRSCLLTNLNGVRNGCRNQKPNDQTVLIYLRNPIKQASMWLRPRQFPQDTETACPPRDPEALLTTTTKPPPTTPPPNKKEGPITKTTKGKPGPVGPTTKTLPVTGTTTVGPTTKTHPTRPSTESLPHTGTPKRTPGQPKGPTTKTLPKSTTTVGPTTKTHPTRPATAELEDFPAKKH